jgi:signal peptidase I
MTSELSVQQVRPRYGEIVTFSDGESYTRYSPDIWTWFVGESEEAWYDCEDLEAAYQAWQSVNAD